MPASSRNNVRPPRRDLDLLPLRHRCRWPTSPVDQGRLRRPAVKQRLLDRGARRSAVRQLRAARQADRRRVPPRRVATDPAAADTRAEHLHVVQAQHRDPRRPRDRQHRPPAAHPDGPQRAVPATPGQRPQAAGHPRRQHDPALVAFIADRKSDGLTWREVAEEARARFAERGRHHPRRRCRHPPPSTSPPRPPSHPLPTGSLPAPCATCTPSCTQR